MPARRQPSTPAAPQLDLFAREAIAGPEERALAEEHSRARALAARLPENLRFGTSSWAYPGWHSIVYPRRASEAQLSRDGLRDYARHPLMRTVGIDRSFYAPVPPADIAHYASQLPAGFPCCAKAPERITSPLDRARGERNPDYLSVERFAEWVLEPFAQEFSSHLGPFLLEFPPLPPSFRPDPKAFARDLDAFLSALPRGLSYAVELRDRALLTGSYARVLARHGASHVYNYWTAMPLPGAQSGRVPIETAAFCVVRLLHRPGTRYDERKNAFAPFDRLRDEDPVMRRDVCALLARAIDARRDTYVLVNNKAEGSSPLTIRALAEALAAG